MSDTKLTVRADGEDVTEALLRAGAQVEVEEAIDEADAASITVGVESGADGEWTSLLDDLAAPDGALTITIEGADASYSFIGVVVGAQWTLDRDGPSSLVVRALDRSVEMDREERVVPWPGTADSAIASTIFGSYGFAAEVETTPSGPDPDAFTPIQRATDLTFLRSLAAKWGFSAYLEADGDKVVGHFHPIDPLAAPAATLRLGFGGDATRSEVALELDGGGAVRADRIPVLSDGAVSGEGDGSDQLQGDEAIATARTVLLGPGDVEGEIDPSAAATAHARTIAFGVTLTAATDPILRGPLVRARRTVDVHGLGTRLSGLYLVERVRHKLSSERHGQEITLVRNALTAGGLSLGGLL